MKRNSFEIGDRVAVLDDNLEGIVSAISDLITIETKEGFNLSYKASELLFLPNYKVLKAADFSKSSLHEMMKAKKSVPAKKLLPKHSRKNQEFRYLEIDLHADKLTKDFKRMSSFDILSLQLDTAKRQIEFAISKRISKIIFIHGVGEGVLKLELHYLLKRFENLKFYDANFQEYGKGATEVCFFQNTKKK